MGDRLRTGKPPRRRTRHPGLLSLSHPSVGRQYEYQMKACFKFFHTKRDGNIPTGTPLPNGGAECKGGMKKTRFTTNIGVYLGTDAR